MKLESQQVAAVNDLCISTGTLAITLSNTDLQVILEKRCV